MSIISKKSSMKSFYSVDQLYNQFKDRVSEVELAVSFISESDEELTKDNIWPFTIVNVFSSTVCLVSIFMIETINLSFVGHTSESKLNLEAVGIGNILLNFTSLFLVFGALGGLDTMGSYCFGKKDYINFGIYTIRMRIIILICYLIFTVPTCLFTGNIITFLGLDSIVSTRAGNYTFNMLPAIFFTFNFNLNVRYLQIMQDYFWVSVISICCTVFHYIANLIMFSYYDSQYIMVAYISNISSFISFFLSTIYIFFFNNYKETLFFSHPNVMKIKEIVFFIKICFFSSLQHYGDYIGYEVVTFMGIYLPIKAENSASLILLNLTNIYSYIYSGSSYPLGQLVSYCLGREDESFYKFIIWTYIKLNLVVGSCLSGLCLIFSDSILSFYTNNDEIKDIATPILYLYALFSLVDNFNVMFQSILRGTGNQHIPSFWNIFMTILITIPLSFTFCFILNLGVIGLWMGIFCFTTSMLLISFYYTYIINFKENSKKIKAQIHGDGGNSQNTSIILRED